MNDDSTAPTQPSLSPDPAQRPVVRMRTPADLVDLLPYLMGFHPTDSIMALGLEGPRLRQGGTVRVDLPDPPQWQTVAAEVARYLVVLSEHRSRRPDAVILYLCRDPAPGDDGRSVRDELRPLAHLLVEAFAAQGVPVHEALCVSDGRWWSYTCRPGCGDCRPEGTPVLREGTTPPIAAAAAYAGIQVRGTLRELHDQLAPIGPPAAEVQRQAFDRVAPRVVQELLGPAGGEAVRERTVELLRSALERFRGGAAELDPELSARLVLGLQDRLARDRAAEWLDEADLAPAQRLWRYLARRCAGPYHPHAAAPLSLLGWTAWIAGDEVVARVALGCALDADPEYTFAQLLYQAINTGADPEPLCRSIRREREARERRRRSGRAGRERRRRPGTGDPAGPGRCSAAPQEPKARLLPRPRRSSAPPSPEGAAQAGTEPPRP
jgi:hypothetical protein